MYYNFFQKKVKISDNNLFESNFSNDYILTENIKICELKTFLEIFLKAVHAILLSYTLNDGNDVSIVMTQRIRNNQIVIAKYSSLKLESFDCDYNQSICQYNKDKFLLLESVSKYPFIDKNISFVKNKIIVSYLGSYNSKFDFSLCFLSHKKLKFKKRIGFSDLKKEFQILAVELDRTLLNMDLIIQKNNDYIKIVEKQRIEKELKQKKDEIARFLRHEIKNNVLNSKGILDDIKFKLKHSEDVTENLIYLEDTIHSTSNNLLSDIMVSEILENNYVIKKSAFNIIELIHSIKRICNSNKIIIHENKINLNLINDEIVLRFILQNAINNAYKHGTKTDSIHIYIDFNSLHKKLKIVIKNKVNQLVKKSNDIESKLFSAGVSNDSVYNKWSSGDGGWIMKKCVESISGSCELKIKNNDAVFILEFPSSFEEIISSDIDLSKWYFIILDDSLIQRKLFLRIFNSEKWKGEIDNGGTENYQIFGEYSESITDNIINHINEKKIFDNFVLIFDKNLDYGNTFKCGLYIGLQIKKYFEDKINLKLFMRTANDSKMDLDYYNKVTDGYILKDYLKTTSFVNMMKEKLKE